MFLIDYVRMRERGPSLRYDVNERPPLLIASGLGLQNALFVISGAIFLPIFMRAQGLISDGEAAFLVSATLLTAGLSTAVQVVSHWAGGRGLHALHGHFGRVLRCDD